MIELTGRHPLRRRPGGEVQELESFGRPAVLARLGEGQGRGVALELSRERGPSPGQDIRRAHCPQVADQLAERRIGYVYPLDVHDWTDEPGGCEERRQSGGFDARMSMRHSRA